MLLHAINETLKTVARWFSYIGALLIMAMMVLITIDVFRRYILNDPLLGTHEVVEYMLLCCFFLFMTDCWNSSTHVRMGIVYTKMTGGVKKAADAFIGVVSLLLFAVLTIQLWKELFLAFEYDQVSSQLLIPVWPFKVGALICMILFVAQLATSTVIPPAPQKHAGD
jgi:TRAP-type C4-dicarboxylate transport system permease small subunit